MLYLDRILSQLIIKTYELPYCGTVKQLAEHVPEKLSRAEFIRLIQLQLGIHTVEMMRIRGKEEAYHYVPAHSDMLVDFLNLVAKLPGKSILEVGCGIGTNLVVGQALLPDRNWYGIDLVPEYVRVTQRLMGVNHAHVVDALEYKKYHFHDIIFMWCPQRDMMSDVYHAIFRGMKPGGILYDVGGTARPERIGRWMEFESTIDWKVSPVGGHYYQKKKEAPPPVDNTVEIEFIL